MYYRPARDDLRQSMSEARTAYYRSRLAGLSHEATWKELRNLGLVKNRSSADLAVDAALLNATFAAHSTTAPDDHIHSTSLLTNSPGLWDLELSTMNEVFKAIQSIKSNSCGADGISRKMIIALLPVLLDKITTLFQRSVEDATFPDIWKKAIIVPINKVASPKSAADYRPIALLPVLGKVLEKLIFNRMTNYLTTNNLLDPFQCGFRANHSTQTALLRLINDVKHGIDRREVTILVLFDFSKAFDTVNHHLLLNKIRSLGFSDSVTDWLASYLTGRRQAVRSPSGNLTSWIGTNAGVPQGSILGPLLFSLFINDIGKAITFSRRLLYADDLQIYASCNPTDVTNCISHINEDIERINQWARSNQLKLNLSKTKAILLGTKRYVNSIGTDTLFLGCDGISIPFSNVVRNLGVFIDSKLTFDAHIQHVCSKANSTFYCINNIRRYTDTDLRRLLVHALILPHINYCSTVLLGISAGADLKLLRLVNKGVRFILGLPRDAHITQARIDLGFLTPCNARILSLMSIIFKLLQESTPSYLAVLISIFTTSRPRRGLHLSSGPLLGVPNHRTNAYKSAFATAAPYLWNALPDQLRALSSLVVFKQQLKNWLLGNEDVWSRIIHPD